VFYILQHLKKVSVERQAPAGLPTVAVCTQIVLFVAQRSEHRLLWLHAVALHLCVVLPTRSEYEWGTVFCVR
jgi:hypothetical protein